MYYRTMKRLSWNVMLPIGADFQKSQWVHAPIPLSSLPFPPFPSYPLPSLPSPTLPFPFLSPSLPLPLSPSLPLEVGPLNTDWGSG